MGSLVNTSMRVAALAAAGFATSAAMASTWQGIPSHLEYGKRVQASQSLSALQDDAFGESVSLYNGATEFQVTDIDLAGNNSLPVRLTRRHVVQYQPQGAHNYDERYRGVANWDVDVPHIASTYPDSRPWPDNRCSGDPKPSVPPSFLLQEIWNGISLRIPGRGDSPLLTAGPAIPVPQDGKAYRYSTRDRDVVDCIPMKSGLSGEGYRVTTADGSKYYFDVAVRRTSSVIERQLRNEEGDAFTYRLPRTKFYLLASRIEDRFGNSVTYQYSTDGFPTRISSSDGRQIILNYSGTLLTSATDGTRTWRYTYEGSGGALAAVTLPDGSAWQYAYVGSLMPSTLGIDHLAAFPYCMQDPLMIDGTYEVRATHPSGLKGVFGFANTRHYKSGVHANECYAFNLRSDAEPDYTLINSHFFDVVSLQRKELSGPGLAQTLRWTYDYHASPDNFATLWGTYGDTGWSYPCKTCSPHKVVVVATPDGTRQRHTFGMLYLVNEGRPIRSETIDTAGTVVRDERTTYLPDGVAGQQAFHPAYGGVLGGVGERTHTYIRPIIERTILQDRQLHYWRVRSTCGSGQTYCFDAFARPTTVEKGSAPAP